MTKPSSQSQSPMVVLGLHKDDHLDIFVRRDDGSVNQAARINSQNGLDPAAMSAVMADLADVFGWRQSVAPPLGVPHLRGVESAQGRAGAVSATASVRSLPAVKKKSPTGRKRRNPQQMLAMKESIRTYVGAATADRPVSVAEVVAFLGRTDKSVTPKTESTVRRNLDELAKENQIVKATADDRHFLYHGKPTAPAWQHHPSTGDGSSSTGEG